MQELKIKIADIPTFEETLRKLGATLTQETTFTDTYFNQPEGEVFKISEQDDGYFLVQFKKTPEGKFEYTKNNKIEHADQVIAEMTNEYGIKCILKGKRKIFSLDEIKITINLIENRGSFVIVTGENPTEDFVVKKLGLPNPEYVKVSFDEVPQISFTLPAE